MELPSIVFVLHIVIYSVTADGNTIPATIQTDYEFSSRSGCEIAGSYTIKHGIRDGSYIEQFPKAQRATHQCVPKFNMPVMVLPTPPVREIPD